MALIGILLSAIGGYFVGEKIADGTIGVVSVIDDAVTDATHSVRDFQRQRVRDETERDRAAYRQTADRLKQKYS